MWVSGANFQVPFTYWARPLEDDLHNLLLAQHILCAYLNLLFEHAFEMTGTEIHMKL